MKKILSCISCIVLLLSGCSYKNIENEYEEIRDMDELIQMKQYDIEYSSSQSYGLDHLANGREMRLEVPNFIIENEETIQFNDEMNRLYEDALNSISYSDEKGEDGKPILLGTNLVNSECYLDQDILSIVIYKGSMVWQSSLGDVEVKTYNYSLKENKFITNEQLFEILGLDKKEIENLLSAELTQNYKKMDVLDGEKISEYNPDYEDCIYYDITNDSKIYLNDGLHFVIQGYSGIYTTNHDIKLTDWD